MGALLRIVLPFLTLLTAAVGATAQDQAASQTESSSNRGLPIFVLANKTSEDSVFGYKQDIIIDGLVEEDVGGINCHIHIKGEVLGNVSSIGGSVHVYKGARIEGNLVNLGGEVTVSSEADLGGRLIHYLRPGETRTSRWLGSPKSMTAFYFAQSLFLFLLVIVTFYIFPNQIHEASFELTQDIARPAIFGFIALATLLLGLFISFLLMVIGVGFLLFLLFFCGIMVASGFGLAVIFYLLGQKIEALSKERLSLTLSILLGVLAAGALLHVPFLGGVIALALLIFGVGIVIETRFGTNKQWFTRRSRYWSAT